MTNPTPRDDFWEVLSDGKSQPVPRPVITILGAGITGLTIAHECAERGFIVQVIEAQQATGDAGGVAVGGIAKTQYAIAIDGERFTRPPVPHLPWLAIRRDMPAGNFHPYSDGAADGRGVANGRKVGVIAGRLQAYADKVHVFGEPARPLAIEVVGVHDDEALPAKARASLEQAVAKARKNLEAALGQDARFTLSTAVEHADPRSEPPGAARPACRIDVRPVVDGITLPGDHGYRFFPSFYRHVFDTMRRTTVFDDDQATPRTTFENLVPTLDISVARENGRATHDIVKKRARSLEDVRSLFESVGTGLGWSVKDMVRYGFFVLKYLTSCTERRTEYETGRYEERLRTDLGLPRVNPTRTWFDFIMGRTDLAKGYPYAEDFLRHLRSTSQALIAMSEQEVDIQTFGNVQMQLLLDHVRSGDVTDMSLNGPTTEAWLRHWKSHLRHLGVRFFPAEVKELLVDERGELYPVVMDTDSGEAVSLGPSAGAKHELPWRDESGTHGFLVPCADPDGSDDVSAKTVTDPHRSYYWASALALDELWLLLAAVKSNRPEVTSDVAIVHVAGVFEGSGTHALRDGKDRYEADDKPGVILAYSAAAVAGSSTPAGDLIVTRLSDKKQALEAFPGKADFDLHLVTTSAGKKCAVLCESGLLDRKADFEAVGLTVATIDVRVFGFLYSRGARRDFEAYDPIVADMQAGLGPTFRQLNRWRLKTERDSGKRWKADEPKPAGHFMRGYTFRDFSGLQYFWDFDFKFNQGHSYFPDSEYGLSSISQPQFWKHVSYKGYRSIVSFDVGNLYRGYRTSLALADRYRANPKTRFVPHPSSAWNSTREELDSRVWDQMKRGMRENFADRLPQARYVHVDDFIDYGARDGRILPVRNRAPFLINAPGQWQNDRPSRTGYGPTMIGDPSDTGAWYLLPQTLDWYEINNRRWVVAGPHMKTFTRMTTMEAANESARHAVNRILHHMGFELDRNDRVRPGFATSGLFLGDFCPIWNMVDHELPDLEGFKRIDRRLLEGGLPHFMDILDLEPQMEAILASLEVADGAVDMAKALGSIVGQLGKLKLPKGGGVLADRAGKQLEKDWHVPNLLGLVGRFFDPGAISSAATEGPRGVARELLKAVRKVDPETRSSLGPLLKAAEGILGSLSGDD